MINAQSFKKTSSNDYQQKITIIFKSLLLVEHYCKTFHFSHDCGANHSYGFLADSGLFAGSGPAVSGLVDNKCGIHSIIACSANCYDVA